MKRERNSEELSLSLEKNAPITSETKTTYTVEVKFRYNSSPFSDYYNKVSLVTFQVEGEKDYYELLRMAKEKCLAEMTDNNHPPEIKLGVNDLAMCSFLQIIDEPSCFGCKYNKPSQREHMEVGGCLYRE